ncbi:MAG: hypothetical protein LBL66_08255 [Clostridiales bacterium]|nr:hypothetical protein [Clostridiales bacterium]
MRAEQSEAWQSLYKKARFVFCRDCRVALCAPRNDPKGTCSALPAIELLRNLMT